MFFVSILTVALVVLAVLGYGAVKEYRRGSTIELTEAEVGRSKQAAWMWLLGTPTIALAVISVVLLIGYGLVWLIGSL